MGGRMRAVDWSRTSLGPVAAWPQSLKTCVRIILTSRQPMFVWWGDELINLYNDAYKTIVGGKHPEVLGQPAAVVWREIWDQVKPRALTAMEGNEGTYDEALLLVMDRNGYEEETYYTFSYSPVPNDQGGTGGLICANTDDTRRILGERQISLLRDLAAGTADARSTEDACLRSTISLSTNKRDLPFSLIYVVDEGKRSLSLAGTSGIERGHRAVPEHVALDDDSTWPFAEVLSTHEIRLVDDLESTFGPLPTGDWATPPKRAAVLPIAQSGETGRAGVLIVGLNPFRLFDDDYRGFLSLVAGQISASIANAQAYEAEKRRAEALSELDRAKTAFFSNVSHEFRTPLTLMMGPAEDALAAADTLPGDDVERWRLVQRNAKRLSKLVNTLLDFSRIEAGRIDASFEATDLAAVTSDLASMFQSAVARGGLALDLAISPLDEPVYVDRDMWEKIVSNLLSNALKHTFEGSIRVALERAGSDAVLVVSDTGIGIPENELPQLFDRFHRVKGARSRTHEGTGIGLALVHELVRVHGGSVQVTSIVGQGTTFRVHVPFGNVHLPAEKIASERPLAKKSGTNLAAVYVEEAMRWLQGDSPGAPLSSERASAVDEASDVNDVGSRILVADDNADMREYVARLLRDRWQVETVADGLAALERARHRPPALIVSDVMMPRLDGVGLVRALRADPRTRSVPIILLSARAGEEETSQGLETGANDYMVKPFSARDLLVRVASQLALADVARETARAAEAERRRLYEVFMQAPMPVIVLRRDALRVELANAAALAVWRKGAEVVGLPLLEAVPELRGQGFDTALQAVIDTGKTHLGNEVVARLARGSGAGGVEDVYLNFVYAPLFEGNGQIEGVLICAFDVTDQVMARGRVESLVELLGKQKQDLEEASRIKDEFLATMSHELRTPLNAILGWTRLMRAGRVDEGRVPRALETIERNAVAQTGLIEDLLDISRIITGKLRLSVEPLDMPSLVASCIDTIRPAADARRITLHPVIDSHAGPVMGDADRLTQIVSNLLSNAVKFTPPSGKVRLYLERVGSTVRLTVSDTGIGIEPAFLPHVFERFRQGDQSITRRHGGIGLGLSIVKHLVELHGGVIGLTSEGTGKGSTFTVTIPLSPARIEPSLAKVPGASLQVPAGLEGVRVLVVDDEEDARSLTSVILVQAGVDVRAAASADEALRSLAEFRPHILICDVGMPDEDGYSLMRRIRSLPAEHGGRVKSAAVTAYARGEDRRRALAAGFNLHLAKPIDPSDLLLLVSSLAERYPSS